MIILILLGIGILAGVVFTAISRKSSRGLRIAALFALALMVLSIIICMFVLFFGANTTTTVEFELDIMPFDEPVQSGPGAITLILFILILIAFFVVVFILSKREQNRANQMPPPPRNDFF